MRKIRLTIGTSWMSLFNFEFPSLVSTFRDGSNSVWFGGGDAGGRRRGKCRHLRAVKVQVETLVLQREGESKC
jgi:hypothetical protein